MHSFIYGSKNYLHVGHIKFDFFVLPHTIRHNAGDSWKNVQAGNFLLSLNNIQFSVLVYAIERCPGYTKNTLPGTSLDYFVLVCWNG